MISKAEIARKSKEWNIRFEVVEKDYSIGWLLKGIAEHPELGKSLIFKGGTALRKCYFENHRFSEDLDFTILSGAEKTDFRKALEDISSKSSRESGCEYAVTGFEKLRDLPNEEAYEGRISFRGPSQPQNLRPVIKIDLTFYAQVLDKPLSAQIIHLYSDTFKTKVKVYTLEEILAEKLRSVLQQKTRVPRPRDFYDIWYLTNAGKKNLDCSKVKDLFLKKCEYKKIKYESEKDFFNKSLLSKNEKAWEASLGRHMNQLVSFEQMILDLRYSIQKIL